MGQTVVEKIAQSHLAEKTSALPVGTGDFISIRPRHVLTHDNTAAVMSKFTGLGVAAIRDPGQPVMALDHDIQNTTEANLTKYKNIEAFAKKQGVVFYPAGTGIGHQIMVEQGFVVPGSFVVASDSHANMYGALGAVGTPVVRTDAATIWATGQFWWQVPRTVRVILEGSLSPGVTGKDVILTLCGIHNQGEVLNAAVEFTGPGVTSLSMDARFTIANMTTEWGALVGWFPADATTLEYLRARARVLAAGKIDRLSEAEALCANAPQPDADAGYAATIRLNLKEVVPFVSGPNSVQVAAPLSEMAEQRIAIKKAYLVSCVNSRLSDIREAAAIFQGKSVAPGVDFYVAAASREVQDNAESEGWWKTLLDAGAKPLPPGCGPCIGLGTGLLEDGEVGISATNRNFKGRMGSPQASCYLASPQVVAASAIAGYIVGPDLGTGPGTGPERVFEEMPAPAPREDTSVEIIDGFPPRIEGRLVWLLADNLNTDGIYGKDYTYREDMTPEAMAKVVLENYDPAIAGETRAGDILVGGFNFGTGSSREQAATALKYKGYPMVIAASFSQTYLRNAFNNGFICIECPDLIRTLRQDAVPPGKTFVIPGDTVAVDFSRSRIHWRDQTFGFSALGRVPQSLVVAGGVENMIRGGEKTL